MSAPRKWYNETAETIKGKSLEDLAAIWRSADSVNWLKGDIAREVETHYGDGDLEKFAELVGESLSTIESYRTVATAYPDEKSRRLDISWSVHQVFASQDDRAALIAGWTGTVREARKLVKDRKAAETETETDTGDNETETDTAAETGDSGKPDYRANAEALNEQVRADAANAADDNHDHAYRLVCIGCGIDPVAAEDFKGIGAWLGNTFKPAQIAEIMKYALGGE
jgi:hypothetical protein